MNPDPYSARVRQYFAKPNHSGELSGAISAVVDAPRARLHLTMTTERDQIRALRFRAWGCPHLIAAAEAFCSEFEGNRVAALQTFAAADLMKSLAVPVEKTGRILALEDAVRQLEKEAGKINT